MRRRKSAWTCALGTTMWMLMATTATAADAPLPLKRVRLYETGVGYFERGGTVGAEGLSLPVPEGHLDDALKTMVVLSPDGSGRVSGISFASSVSANMGRAIAGLDPEGSGSLDLPTLLKSLEGAPVSVTTKARQVIKGRLVKLEEPDGTQRCVTEVVDGKSTRRCETDPSRRILVLTEDGGLRRFEVDEVEEVKPTDPAWSKRMASAMSSLSSGGGSKDAKAIKVQGQGKVQLGYIAESPVWRSTYRLVLGDEASALQGWALIHNDTGEKWSQVDVELVNGQPDSFLFPLAAPRYAHRDLRTPDRSLSTVPQLMGRLVDNMWSESFGDSFGAGGLGLSGVGMGGGGRGEGIGLGTVGTIGHGSGGRGESDVLSVGNLADVGEADGVESGAMFRYRLRQPVSLNAHSSALIPFVQSKVEVRRLAYFSQPGVMARTAVDVVNETKQTLPEGTISVFADGGFAGETQLSRTKPGERRILTFGLDLDVELERGHQAHEDEPKVVQRLASGGLRVHFIRHHTVDYEVENKSGAGRKVFFPLPFVRNASVRGADEIVFDQEHDKALAVFDAPGRSKQRKTLKVDEGLWRDERTADRKTLQGLLAVDSIDPKQREILRKVLGFLDEAAQKKRAWRKTIALRGELITDAYRMRKNVAAVGDDGDAAEELAERLLKAEDRLEAMRNRIAGLKKREGELRSLAEKALEQLSNVR